MLCVESRVPQSVRNGLATRGHTIVDWASSFGAPAAVRAAHGSRRGVISAGATPGAMLCGWLVALASFAHLVRFARH
jgi:hypothetical protein